MRYKSFHLQDAFLLLAALLVYGCSGSSRPSEQLSPPRQQAEAKPAQDQAPQASSKSSDPQNIFDQWSEGVPPGLKEAWQLLTVNGRYRLAREEDFKFPAGVKRYAASFPRHPYFRILWDIRLDGEYNNFLCVVVDATKSDDARFGMVMLNAPRSGNGPTKCTLFSAIVISQERLHQQQVPTCLLKHTTTTVQAKYALSLGIRGGGGTFVSELWVLGSGVEATGQYREV